MKHELPDDLADIERRLAGRSLKAPSALRGRVLAAITRELTLPARTQSQGITWSYLAAAAAVLVIALNLARMSAMVTDFVGAAPPRNHRALALAAEIRAVVPELSPKEAQRMAMVMTAGEGLTPMPLVHGRNMPDTSSAMLQER